LVGHDLSTLLQKRKRLKKSAWQHLRRRRKPTRKLKKKRKRLQKLQKQLKQRSRKALNQRK
jgi:hypothetical protein